MVGRGSFPTRTVQPNPTIDAGHLATPAEGLTDLSSAEDMNLLTTPPTAESSVPAAGPSEPPTAPSEPPFEETPVEMEEIASPTPKPLLKANMVAQEVRVIASGAPPDKNALDRQLFAEETTSILVCETGGVIQLSAAVSPGQLLVLTNFESKREVIAQVRRKRAYRPTICYVELEFAEAAPRFWGREFSAASALLPKNAQDAKTADLVVAAEATADEPGELPAAPTVEELDVFKRDVAVLRGQPVLVQTPLENIQPPPASAPPLVSDAPSSLPAGALPGTEPGAISESTNNSLPMEQSPVPTQWPAEDQMQQPQPALDFSMALPKRKRSLRARGSFTPNFRGGVMRLALLTAALVVTAVGAAWFKHWLPWQSGTKKSLSNRSVNAGNTNTSLPPGSPETASPEDFSNARVASDAPITSAGTSRSAAVPGNDLSDPKDATESTAQPSGLNGSGALLVKKASPSTTLAAKRTPDRPTATAAPGPVAASAAERDFVPPKLIKSVRAVASLEALRDFETGNVVIDAVVGAAGEVNFISVLSGPPSLRPAAVESLKEYRYEPATRNGQPVPAHVTITIHFRFEP
jgi:periplasmic protein TonB